MQSPALAQHIAEEVEPGADCRSDDALDDYIRRRGSTVYHPVSTCRMGRGADAVVDSELKVIGLEGLRVADASVFPSIIGGNTNAPVVMVAEKAAEHVERGEERADLQAEDREADAPDAAPRKALAGWWFGKGRNLHASLTGAALGG